MNRPKIIILFLVISSISLQAQENTTPKILGNINLRYRYDDTENATSSNSFDVRRARLDVRGNVVKPLEYRIHIEFANSPRMLDANLNWKINQHVSLIAGQYKIPFSLENPYNPNALEMIDNSLVITHLVNYEDVSGIRANGRDIGVSLNGNFFKKDGYSLINYYFGLFNGAGINNSDTNNAKDFSGILSINPNRRLTLAVSHYNGKIGANNNTRDRIRNGFGIKYKHNSLYIRSEYIDGKTWDATNNEYFRSQGAYAVFGYHIGEKLQPLARCDYFKYDKSESRTQQLEYTAGVNYFPVENVRLQFNYTRKTKKDDLLNDNNYIVTQIWIKF